MKNTHHILITEPETEIDHVGILGVKIARLKKKPFNKVLDLKDINKRLKKAFDAHFDCSVEFTPLTENDVLRVALGHEEIDRKATIFESEINDGFDDRETILNLKPGYLY